MVGWGEIDVVYQRMGWHGRLTEGDLGLDAVGTENHLGVHTAR